MAERHSYITIE